jgi:hypothetical protein
MYALNLKSGILDKILHDVESSDILQSLLQFYNPLCKLLQFNTKNKKLDNILYEVDSSDIIW